MKILLTKFCIYILILLSIKLLLDIDGIMFQKSKIGREKINTVFIGSSRTEYGISPAYFDLLTQHHTNSYNFGIPYGLPPGTFDRCEELIQYHSPLKYIFFELSGETPTYLTSLKHWTFEQSNTFHNNLVLNVFKPHTWKIDIPISNNDQLNLPENDDNGIKRTFLLKQINLAYQRNLQVEKEKKGDASLLNELYWKRILKLIALAESKQIRIYFFIPPRLETDNEVRTIYPLYQKLDIKYKLKVAHYEESLFKVNTSLDEFHLNQKGAKRFTELMAEAFIKQNKDFK